MKRTITFGLALLILLAAGCTDGQTRSATIWKNTDQIVEIASVGMEPPAGGQTEPSVATEPSGRSWATT